MVVLSVSVKKGQDWVNSKYSGGGVGGGRCSTQTLQYFENYADQGSYINTHWLWSVTEKVLNLDT